MRKVLLWLGKAYLAMAGLWFVIGIAFGIWMISNGQQPLDLLSP